MDVADDQKQTMHRYLRDERDGLLSKLDGLGEYDMRRPLTPTGTNLLGVVKHVASVGLDYFTITFGRPRGRGLPWFEEGAEPDADFYATPEETSAEIIDLYRFAADAADATITELPLDAPGEVPWWPEGRRAVTLHRILVHMTVETARHAGHVDIVRELDRRRDRPGSRATGWWRTATGPAGRTTTPGSRSARPGEFLD